MYIQHSGFKGFDALKKKRNGKFAGPVSILLVLEVVRWLMEKSGFQNYSQIHTKVIDAFVCHKYNDVRLPEWADAHYEAILFAVKLSMASLRAKSINGAMLLKWVGQFFSRPELACPTFSRFIRNRGMRAFC